MKCISYLVRTVINLKLCLMCGSPHIDFQRPYCEQNISTVERFRRFVFVRLAQIVHTIA